VAACRPIEFLILKPKRRYRTLALIPFLLILGFFAYYFAMIFGDEAPSLLLEPLPQYLSRSQEFNLKTTDKKRGVRLIKVSLRQGPKQIVILEESFPFEGLWNAGGVHSYSKDFVINPLASKLAQGEANLLVQVWNYSRKAGGDGNLSVIRHKMIVDTLPPSVRAVSRMHNVNVGGSALVIYQTSSDSAESGVFVNNVFSRGFAARENADQGIYCCYFALPYDVEFHPRIRLWSRDKAGNTAEAPFPCHIRRKTFRNDKVELSDRFIQRVLPYFAAIYPSDDQKSPIEAFLKINRKLRKKNHEVLYMLKDKTSARRLWDGTWLRQKNSANMARFADHRLYFYKGKKVDEQDHLGIDLASSRNAPVEAANRGRVIYADRLGIYGLTVVLDHGQGLTSVYGHLSKIEVSIGQEVNKGSVLGLTGETGLAGGDHLHFAIMVSGICVNPIEWWDDHWVKDNILGKLALAESPLGPSDQAAANDSSGDRDRIRYMH
jgi:murein DD-endopeptidase MepM/ murein hydrolase activator NlpD